MTDWPHFTQMELSCKGENCCNHACAMDAGFMDILEAIRTEYGKPMIVTSGYRCELHNRRVRGGPEHPMGKAVDIAVSNPDAMELVAVCLRHGIRRIGVSQRGARPRFVHIGGADDLPVAIWSYA